MSKSDAFALKNSGLNEFLFAEVGIETNGSPLTILSVLARLGQDPWAEAARWAKLPKASAIECLANIIARMPLRPQAVGEARATAARLIILLPTQTQSFQRGENVANGKSTVPKWFPIAVFLAALAFGIGFEMIPSASPTNVAGQGIGHLEAPKD
jgi:hypothetical protein